MKKVLPAVSFLGLALTLFPAFFVFSGAIPWQTHANLMAGGMVLWFVTAPFWMGKKN